MAEKPLAIYLRPFTQSQIEHHQRHNKFPQRYFPAVKIVKSIVIQIVENSSAKLELPAPVYIKGDIFRLCHFSTALPLCSPGSRLPAHGTAQNRFCLPLRGRAFPFPVYQVPPGYARFLCSTLFQETLGPCPSFFLTERRSGCMLEAEVYRFPPFCWHPLRLGGALLSGAPCLPFINERLILL